MVKNESFCAICGMQLDDNHFAPASFPGLAQAICCNCEENLGLMFTNFEEKPGADHGYIVPDNSNLLEEITGRSYIENRLIYYKDVLDYQLSEKEDTNHEVIEELTKEIERIEVSLGHIFNKG